MIRILAEGENLHRLEDASGCWIGWVRGRSIGLRGMHTETEAIAMAGALWEPLEAALARQFPGRAVRSVLPSEIRIVHDGSGEWVSDGRIPMARLLREADGRSARISLEFPLPSYAHLNAVLSVAHVVALAFCARRAAEDGEARARADRQQRRRDVRNLAHWFHASGTIPPDAA